MGYGQYSDNHAGRTNPLANQPKPKRQKQVFDTGEIPHLWFHRSQESARNPQGNLFFRGDTIFSYGEHFPLARHVTSKSGKHAVMVNSGSYSFTTSGHQSQVRQAIASGTLVFEVPSIREHSFDHAANLEHFVRESEKALQTAERARKHGKYELATAMQMRDRAREYAKFFGQKMPKFGFLPAGKKLEALRAKITEREKRAKELDAVADARRAAREAERQRLRALEMPEKIAAWRNGGNLEYWDLRGLPTMLRLKDDQVETSMGAKVPAEHALRALKLVRACVSAGREYQRNGHTEHVGNYAIDRIEANGTLHAGCHVIALEEIERFAPVLEARQGKADAGVAVD